MAVRRNPVDANRQVTAGLGSFTNSQHPLCLEFIKTWRDAGIPNIDTLRAMTTNGYKVSETEETRGPLKPGVFADMIAVPGNPIDDLGVLKRVQFVMKDGQVFKRHGIMTPAAFFHGGPVNGWRIR